MKERGDVENSTTLELFWLSMETVRRVMDGGVDDDRSIAKKMPVPVVASEMIFSPILRTNVFNGRNIH